MKKEILMILTLALLLVGCGAQSAEVTPEEVAEPKEEVVEAVKEEPVEEPAVEQPAFEQIEQNIAYEMMSADDFDGMVLDVRTLEEYDEGHIPGAICIPVETIDGVCDDLPDLEQTILVYCRSGNRSKQAAQKLVDAGYTAILEFGGIIDWQYDIVETEFEEPDEVFGVYCTLTYEDFEIEGYGNAVDDNWVCCYPNCYAVQVGHVYGIDDEALTYKTVRGIGLGSTLGEVYEAYGKKGKLVDLNYHEFDVDDRVCQSQLDYFYRINPGDRKIYNVRFFIDQNEQVLALCYGYCIAN